MGRWQAAGTDRTGADESSKNLFGSGQAAPKSGTAVRNEDGSLGMRGQEEVCGVLGECPENE